MRAILILAGLGALCGAAHADEMRIDIEVPRLSVAEYHKPYVALWISRPDQTAAAHLDVWYQQSRGAEGEGERWLVDIRQWWRRVGRELDLPMDGKSGPTRAPGQHTVTYRAGTFPMRDLPAGEYVLNVEAAREVGGRELVRIPFTWRPGQAAQGQASGETELGDIRISITPTP